MKKKRTAPETHCDPQMASHKGDSAYSAKCPVPIGLLVSVEEKHHERRSAKSELSCVKDEVAIPSLIIRTVSVDVKQH